jgi:arsenate reductase
MVLVQKDGFMKMRVLILCTGNSCRSQMAEGLWQSLAGDAWEVISAGSKPTGFVHPLAIKAMAELGKDISAYSSKHVNEFSTQDFDLVITVCDSAKESCPILPGAVRTMHWPFPDPAEAEGSDADRLEAFRRIRDAIHDRIRRYLRDGS